MKHRFFFEKISVNKNTPKHMNKMPALCFWWEKKEMLWC